MEDQCVCREVETKLLKII